MRKETVFDSAKRKEYLQKEILLFANHSGKNHWNLFVIDVVEKKFFISCSLSRPLQSDEVKFFSEFTKFLFDEELKCQPLICPQQADSHSCGFYVIFYMLSFWHFRGISNYIQLDSVKKVIISSYQYGVPISKNDLKVYFENWEKQGESCVSQPSEPLILSKREPSDAEDPSKVTKRVKGAGDVTQGLQKVYVLLI